MNMFFKNSVIKPITVEFVGEEAVDNGGPVGELYTTFYDNASGKLLYGPEKITHLCMMHTEMKSVIFIFSKSLLQGVPGPLCSCNSLAECILPDGVKLEAISNAQSEEELASCLKDFKERFVSGYNKFLIKLSDKANLLQKVSRYYVITRQLEAIQQFTSGLSS